MPLVVLSVQEREVSPGFAFSAEEVAAMQRQMHAELAAMSTRGELVPVEGSAHYVQLDQPQLVIQAISKVIGGR